jgi:hypothetical protein
MTLGQILAMAKPLSLPVLLWVGRWLKGQSWVANKTIPYAVLGLNGAMWVLLQMGLVTQGTGGQLAPVTPEEIGLGAAGVPGLALMAWAMPGWAGAIAGTVFSVGVEQFLVNRAHKGLKYRAMFKLAERMNWIPGQQAKELRLSSKW